jgi:aerobic carbon-monoxide dehydrogenase medium subunit
MIPSAFDYARPSTVDEAIAALQAGGEDAKIMGGGQSLMPVLRLRMASPSVVVDTTRIDEMKGISDSGDAISIGAGETHHAVMNHPLVKEHVPLLAQATATVADPQIRHRGTVGGALAHADPAGDLPAVAQALDAQFTIAGPTGRRTVGAAEFFQDYFTTAVGPDEVLVSMSFPKLGAGWGTHYEKFNRTAQAWAIVGVAAAVKTEGGKITEARVGLTNMGPTPVRASAVEAALVGAATMADIEAAAANATQGTSPTSDIHAQSDYREHLATVLTKRAVATAANIS